MPKNSNIPIEVIIYSTAPFHVWIVMDYMILSWIYTITRYFTFYGAIIVTVMATLGLMILYNLHSDCILSCEYLVNEYTVVEHHDYTRVTIQ